MGRKTGKAIDWIHENWIDDENHSAHMSMQSSGKSEAHMSMEQSHLCGLNAVCKIEAHMSSVGLIN